MRGKIIVPIHITYMKYHITSDEQVCCGFGFADGELDGACHINTCFYYCQPVDGAFLLHDDVSASLQGCSLQKPLSRFYRWNGCLTFKIGFFRLSHIFITQLFYNINGLLWMEQESRDLGVMKAFPLSAWTLMPSFLLLCTQKALKHLFFCIKANRYCWSQARKWICISWFLVLILKPPSYPDIKYGAL